MVKINIIGPMFGTSGYSNHIRQLANALYKVADVKISTQLFPNWELQTNDAELDMINKSDSFDRLNLIIDLPLNWSTYTNKKINIAYLVWEGDKIPLSWIDCITDKRINQVWVPSSHVLNAIKNTYPNWLTIQNKIKIIPHGVDISIFQPTIQEKSIFTFVCNKGFRGENDRGGIQHALRAFIQEFNKGEARLMVKLNPAYTLPPEQISQLIQKYRFEAGKSEDKMPEIIFNIGNIPYKELVNLYNAGDVFLNPTEGEAFSLCALESMACGRPTISTNFGGQTDFVNNGNGWLIDYKLKPVEHELMYEGIQWAVPDLEQLKKTMRICSIEKDIVLLKSIKSLETAKQYTWNNSSQKALESLKETQ